MRWGEIREGTRLLLIRHGETDWNREQRVQGHQDALLSELGVRQAECLADWLDWRPAVIYASPLQRAWRTAELLTDGSVPLIPEPRLREVGMGRFEGLTTREIQMRYPVAWAAWRRDAIRHRPPEGEGLLALQERAVEALAERLPQHPGETVALVMHGGTVRVLVCALLGVPIEVYPHLRVDNASVTRFLFRAWGPTLVGFNEIAHLRGLEPGSVGG
ncbi:MAG: histidine phosphatase family protein [Armatimonadetes bacterium]|nr:histidine phosphatase family protein [Armatimonadota bacterium]